MPKNDRNEAYEFAVRTRRNLVAIEKSKSELHGEPVHVVVQLTNSLLGLIVFPKEKEVFNRAKEKTIDAMIDEGWSVPRITLDSPKKPQDKTATPYDILKHLRNAVAHGRLTFNSDSGEPNEVAVTVADNYPKDSEPYWRAEIEVVQLRTFCFRLLDFIEHTTG
jgi:hypothetical protein